MVLASVASSVCVCVCCWQIRGCLFTLCDDVACVCLCVCVCVFLWPGSLAVSLAALRGVFVNLLK